MRTETNQWMAILFLAVLSGVLTGCDTKALQEEAKQAELKLVEAKAKTAEAQERLAEAENAVQAAKQKLKSDAEALQEKQASESQEKDSPDTEENYIDPEKAQYTAKDLPTTWKRLSKTEEIWIDTVNREVIIGGKICMTQGPLEMFVCPENTKEHESVVSANALASKVHACLVALNAPPGAPTSWDPSYTPAHGPSVDITMMWKGKEGKFKKQNSREWIRNMQTNKPLSNKWVFGGSDEYEDPDTKEKIYYGDSGELICLSNFSTATIDINVESSQSNAGLLFEAATENIPPIGTQVFVIIKPGDVIPPVAKEQAAEQPTDHSKEADQEK